MKRHGPVCFAGFDPFRNNTSSTSATQGRPFASERRSRCRCRKPGATMEATACLSACWQTTWRQTRVWLPSLARDVAIAEISGIENSAERGRRVEIDQIVRVLSRLSFPHRLHGALVGAARYAALLRQYAPGAEGSVQTSVAADPANCGCSDSTNAWLACWFRPFAGGHCPAMPQCDERQHQSPRSSSHQDPGALAKVGRVAHLGGAAAIRDFASPSPALRQESMGYW